MEYTIEDVIWAFEPFFSESEVDVVNSKFGYLIIMHDKSANNFVIFNQAYSIAEELLNALINCISIIFAGEQEIEAL